MSAEMGRSRHVVIHDVIHDGNEMGRDSGRDQSAIRTWPCACARMCHAYIRQLAHGKQRPHSKDKGQLLPFFMKKATCYSCPLNKRKETPLLH